MTRNELYDLVWDEPVSQLAQRLGLSGNGLAKLCARHDIPVPPRGYRQRIEAGQKVPQTPLAPRETDEVIPRFATLDAKGNKLPPVQEEQWVIPGILKVVQTVLEPKALPGDTSAAELLLDASTPAPPPLVERIEAEEATPVEPPPAEPSGATAARLNPSSEALSAADLERVVALGSRHQRHQAARELLSAVAVRALEDPSASEQVLQWVELIRRRLESDDPVRALIDTVKAR